MPKISFVKKLITCALAGLIIGEAAFRQGITYFRPWIPFRALAILPLGASVAAILCAMIWQARKTNQPSTLAFWQGLIRYGVAFDLAEFGWSKIFRRQFVMPASILDLPYRNFSPSELFWTFFSHSYLFACILGGLEIAGGMLLLFRRTRLVGVFVLLPILANILMMDIFYGIGAQGHAAIMLAGVLYFLFLEFDRLRDFFFAAKDQLPVLPLSRIAKGAIRLSIIYIPLLLLASTGNPDKHPELTGKYEVKQRDTGLQVRDSTAGAGIPLTVVYFDIRNGCVFEFGTPQKRWNGRYTKANGHLEISWRAPADKPVFSGTLLPASDSGTLEMRGMLGKDPVDVILKKDHK